MQIPGSSKGIVLICDPNGRIFHVRRDTERLFKTPDMNENVLSFVAPLSQDTVTRFFSAIESDGSAVSERVVLTGDNSGQPLFLVGTRWRNWVVVIGADSPAALGALLTEVLYADDKPVDLDALCGDEGSRIGTHSEDYLILEDFTRLNNELVNMSRELNQKNVELAQLSELKNQFLGMATHDLRNPVGSVLLNAELLIDWSDSMSSDQVKCLQNIRSSALRMSRVINDFLDVSIIESGHLTLDIQKVNLADLGRSVQTNVSASATKNQIRFDMELDPATLTLMVDGPKIEQVFTNLLSNAVEYSHIGGCVTIRSHRLNEGVRFEVEDRGRGIPPEQQKRLFGSFSGSGTRKRDGERSIGLGLIIARKIVEAHGGKMFVESEPGKGSVFGFILPDSCLQPSISGQTAEVSGRLG
jgi:signal transduction histidine kinase